MEYLIIYQGQAIATIIHPEADAGQGVVIGPFLPFPAYESVRPVFRVSGQLMAADGERGKRNEEAWQHYFRQREELMQQISITTHAGLPVDTVWIDVFDCSEQLGEQGYEAHFAVAPPTFFTNALLWDQKAGKKRCLLFKLKAWGGAPSLCSGKEESRIDRWKPGLSATILRRRFLYTAARPSQVAKLSGDTKQLERELASLSLAGIACEPLIP